jgi:protein-tyrosine phosphatase
MTEVFSWRNDPDTLAVISRTVEALRGGQLVVLPTDTDHAVCADPRHPSALAALAALSGAPWDLALSSFEQSLQAIPAFGPAARRLARRCWPGPITLQMRLTETLAAALPEAVCDRAGQHGWLSLRSPAHPALLHVLHFLDGPLVLAPMEFGHGDSLPGVTLVVNDGPPAHPEGASVVRVEEDVWEVVREGAVPAERLRSQLATVIVFVCTGNTCRSPMAEALCKKRLAERLNCPVAELQARGYLVTSAGVAAYPDEPAAAAAVETARAYGMDLGEHRSQPLDPELALLADQLVCMTRSHLELLCQHYPDLGCTPRLLSAEGADLSDPFGQDDSVYRDCAARIWNDLEELLRQL